MKSLLVLILTLTLASALQALTPQASRLHRLMRPTAEQNKIPADLEPIVQFYVYTRRSPNEAYLLEPEVESVVRSSLQAWKPITVAIPSWGGSLESPEIQIMVESKLQQEDCNVIAVDLSALASNRANGATNTGEAIADLLLLLNKNFNVSFERIQLAGFSDGAHIAGLTGRIIHQRKGAQLPHITALDPTMNTGNINEDERLSVHDAEFVEVVHTSAGTLGYQAPIGHADYYPNGGAVQPACAADDVTCSHKRAYELVGEMWSQRNDFVTLKCSSVEQMNLEACTWVNVKMGQNMKNKGLYYLETNGQFPYAKGSFVHSFF